MLHQNQRQRRDNQQRRRHPAWTRGLRIPSDLAMQVTRRPNQNGGNTCHLPPLGSEETTEAAVGQLWNHLTNDLWLQWPLAWDTHQDCTYIFPVLHQVIVIFSPETPNCCLTIYRQCTRSCSSAAAPSSPSSSSVLPSDSDTATLAKRDLVISALDSHLWEGSSIYCNIHP